MSHTTLCLIFLKNILIGRQKVTVTFSVGHCKRWGLRETHLPTTTDHCSSQWTVETHTAAAQLCITHRCRWAVILTERNETEQACHYCLSVKKKEDVKLWNEDKMRKWSHTFCTCPKTPHPHLPLGDHGSCCHIAHETLSFPWFSRKTPSFSEKLMQ